MDAATDGVFPSSSSQNQFQCVELQGYPTAGSGLAAHGPDGHVDSYPFASRKHFAYRVASDYFPSAVM